MMTAISGKPMRMAEASFAVQVEGNAGAIVASDMFLPPVAAAPRRKSRSRSSLRVLIPVVLALACSAAVAKAQFASSVDLVEVYATITDRTGAPITGLRAEDFTVFEDQRPQGIQAFAAGDFPLSIALAIDHSASMAGSRLRLAAAAARRFLERLRPEDQVMIVGVSSEVEVLAPLSADRARQGRVIDLLQPWSTTALNDALIAGIDLIQPARGRRGLIVLSDGEDRYSEARPDAVLARARRADVMVYPIAIGRRAPDLFAEIAALTGGRSFRLEDAGRLDQALSDIARELRHQYLLGYAPARPGAGANESGWHSIEVRVRRNDVRVRARDGYYGK